MRKIFVSSTFKDMQQERDAIRVELSSKINQCVQKFEEGFEFCDLRWGIDTSDLSERDAAIKVMDVCFKEIDNSDSPMIVLIGNRYGWTLENEYLNEILKRIPKEKRKEFREMSATALEIEYGAFSSLERLKNTFFYFRNIVNEDEVPEEYVASDENEKTKITELKNKISKLSKNVYEYNVTWDSKNAKFRTSDIEKLENKIVEDIVGHYEKSTKEKEITSEFERYKKQILLYIRYKNSMFAARENELKSTCDMIENHNVVCIHGITGIGKSTFMSKIYQHYSDNHGWYVVPLFCGCGNHILSTYDMIRVLAYDLEEFMGVDHSIDDINQNPDINVQWDGFDLNENVAKSAFMKIYERLDELYELFQNTGKHLLILCDAIDELIEDEYKVNGFFLPDKKKKNIHVCYSVNDTVFSRYKIPEEKKILLENIDKDQRYTILKRNLRGKEVAEEVISGIVNLENSGIPLYLNLVVNRFEIMTSSDYIEIKKKGNDNTAIKDHMLNVVRNMPIEIAGMVKYLINEIGKKTEHEFISNVIKFIVISQKGLTKENLQALFRVNNIKWNDLYFSIMVSLLSDFFVLRADGRYDFSHSSIKNTLNSTYEDLEKYRSRLLSYVISLENSDFMKREELVPLSISCDRLDSIIGYISANMSYGSVFPEIVRKIMSKENYNNMVVVSRQFLEICMNGDSVIINKLFNFSFNYKKGRYYGEMCAFFCVFLSESFCAEEMCVEEIYEIGEGLIRSISNLKNRQSRAVCCAMVNFAMANICLDFNNHNKNELHHLEEVAKSMEYMINKQFGHNIPVESILELFQIRNRIDRLYSHESDEKGMYKANMYLLDSFEKYKEMRKFISNDDLDINYRQLLLQYAYNVACARVNTGRLEEIKEALNILEGAYEKVCSFNEAVWKSDKDIPPEAYNNLFIFKELIANVGWMYKLSTDDKISEDYLKVIEYAERYYSLKRDFKSSLRLLRVKSEYYRWMISNSIYDEFLENKLFELKNECNQLYKRYPNNDGYIRLLDVMELIGHYYIAENSEKALESFNEVKEACRELMSEDYEKELLMIMTRILCSIADIIVNKKNKKSYNTVEKIYDECIGYMERYLSRKEDIDVLYEKQYVCFHKVNCLFNLEYKRLLSTDKIKVMLSHYISECEMLHEKKYRYDNVSGFLLLYYVCNNISNNKVDVSEIYSYAEKIGKTNKDVDDICKCINEDEGIIFIPKEKKNTWLAKRILNRKLVKVNKIDNYEILFAEIAEIEMNYDVSIRCECNKNLYKCYLHLLHLLWKEIEEKKRSINMLLCLKIASLSCDQVVGNNRLYKYMEDAIAYIEKENKDMLASKKKDSKILMGHYRNIKVILMVEQAIIKQDLDYLNSICKDLEKKKGTYSDDIRIVAYEKAIKLENSDFLRNWIDVFYNKNKDRIGTRNAVIILELEHAINPYNVIAKSSYTAQMVYYRLQSIMAEKIGNKAAKKELRLLMMSILRIKRPVISYSWELKSYKDSENFENTFIWISYVDLLTKRLDTIIYNSDDKGRQV